LAFVSITDLMQTAPEQDGAPTEAKPTPLFRFDPGWSFVIAGLLLLVTAVLIPAQRDLHELRNALEVQRAAEDQALRQLGAYDRFLNDLSQAEPQLVSRLAASQLNLMPKDERSMLLVPSLNSTVTDWIEDSEPLLVPAVAPYPDTLLSRLATGPRRLWVLACGAFLVFVGLMLSPTAGRAPRSGGTREPSPIGLRFGNAFAPIASASGATLAHSQLSISATAHDAGGDAEAELRVSPADCVALLDEPLDADDVRAVEPVADVIDDLTADDGIAEHAIADHVVADHVASPDDCAVSEHDVIARDESADYEVDEMNADDVDEVEALRIAEPDVAADAELRVGSGCERGQSSAPSLDESIGYAVIQHDGAGIDGAGIDGAEIDVAETACSVDRHAVIVEWKPIESDLAIGTADGLQASLEDSASSVDGRDLVAFEARAETEACVADDALLSDETVLSDETDPEDGSVQTDERSLPSPTDRTLDVISLFHGVGDDRWIDTRARR
jgi:hypothetical protein